MTMDNSSSHPGEGYAPEPVPEPPYSGDVVPRADALEYPPAYEPEFAPEPVVVAEPEALEYPPAYEPDLAPEPAAAAEPDVAREPAPAPAGENPLRMTRAGTIWVATGAALILLILLIIFMMQNQDSATLNFLGWSGQAPLGIAMLIAAVAGGIIVAIAGATRVVQLRKRVRRSRREDAPKR